MANGLLSTGICKMQRRVNALTIEASTSGTHNELEHDSHPLEV